MTAVLAIVQEYNILGVDQQRIQVRSYARPPFPQPHDRRRPHFGQDDLLKILVRNRGDGEGPLQILNSSLECLFQIILIVFFYQMDDHFGIGFGIKFVALFPKVNSFFR